MILQLLNIILHLSQVQILINIYNMPQHLLSICTGCKYSSVSCDSLGKNLSSAGAGNWLATIWDTNKINNNKHGHFKKGDVYSQRN